MVEIVTTITYTTFYQFTGKEGEGRDMVINGLNYEFHPILKLWRWAGPVCENAKEVAEDVAAKARSSGYVVDSTATGFNAKGEYPIVLVVDPAK